MTELYYPLHSLREGHWFKLICGASFQHLPAVRNLTLAYTLAGADCIDVAADPAVIAAAKEAIEVASELGEVAQVRGFGFRSRPWLMVSLNDGEDPHFRKAEFNPELCPADCPRPCEKICPAQAIVFQKASDHTERKKEKKGAQEGSRIPKSQPQIGSRQIAHRETPLISDIQQPKSDQHFSGVIDQQCYGCGRCLPVCPSELIYTRSYVSAPEAIAPLILRSGVDALEIHTQVGHFADFQRLWNAIAPWVEKLKLLAISCPDDDGLIEYLWSLYELIKPLPCALVWQTDGRPMSGDIGAGATRAAVKLSDKVIAAGLPGYVQLAGGTNNHTVAKLKAAGLLKEWGMGNGEWGDITEKIPFSPVSPCFKADTVSSPLVTAPHCQPYVAGIAYGSYARVLLSPILDKLEELNGEDVERNLVLHQSPAFGHLEALPELLWQAVASAHSLVSQLKFRKKLPQPLPN
ncbi:4Fe-4S ferredoxin [Microcoleus sp. FACHB-SPT15]|uniref:Light dependent period protein LdpA domain-containing protein n=1 Tax=Microcoleus sp. FACHB-SPT15 TaxID=2692830 RepID=UPI00178458F9|nr:LdpA C-terminal domain-containing domain [Microcoleus sp. FACHB-SPT15]MBD1809185.1 4Fe-4S ferredoxin [Microcoleus sp. FACHB-SPT15]